MTALVATGHIIGTLIALTAFSVGALLLAGWESERNRKFALQEMSIELAIPVGELNNAEHQTKVIEFFAHRFSSELLRNRLSDFCGLLQTGWGWMGALIQVGALLACIWYTATDDLSNGVYAWLIVAVSFFFWVVSVLFALTCKLLTGRFPNQARQSRKLLANIAEEERVISANYEIMRDVN